jgi:protein disulfide-isomerase
MRPLFYFWWLALLAFPLKAQEISWQTDANVTIQQSLQSGKPILMFFTGSDWCGWCIKLQKEVFTTDAFKQWVADKYLLLELDFPRRKKLDPNQTAQNNHLQQIFQVRGYPTVFLVQPEQKENSINLQPLARTGYVAGGPEKWIESVEKFLKSN